ETVPLAAAGDGRLALLERESDAEDLPDEDAEDVGDEPAPRAASSGGSSVRAFLEQQSREQLVELLEDLAASHPTVHQALRDRVELASGRTSTLVKGVQQELAKLEGGPRRRGRW